MGCKLPKPRGSEEAPGKIYSTLRKAQVETHTGVAYTYHFLDFLLGKEEVAVSSLLCLSSVRELPVQVCELYQQGFILAAVHPFVHSCGPAKANLQRQLHRAVLIRETNSCSENAVLKCVRPRLETDVCFSGLQAPAPEVIQGYVKKVQDLADSGVLFVGFLQQPGGGPYFLGHGDTEELSSLHSSPSPIHQHPEAPALSPSSNHQHQDQHNNHCRNGDHLKDQRKQSYQHKTSPSWIPCPGQDCGSEAHQQQEPESFQCRTLPQSSYPAENQTSDLQDSEAGLQRQTEAHRHQDTEDGSRRSSEEPHPGQENRPLQTSSENQRTENPGQVRNPDKPGKTPGTTHSLNRVQVFALYNHAVVLSGSPRFYSLRIPLQVHTEAGLISTVDAHWLDHMTQHFRSGAQLIDGYFHLGDDPESSSTIESVFIFQSASEDIMTATTYDAIVVEQWTVIDGVAVKTDYIPLLQSLAPYGWRLMCVLPTPIVRTNSDGSLATKQILFLQRPVLSRKRRDFTRLHLRGRSKRNLSSKESVGRDLLSAASPAPPEPETAADEREGWMKDEGEEEEMGNGQTDRATSERNSDDSRTLQVIPHSHGAPEELEVNRSVRVHEDKRGGVTCLPQEEEVRPLVPERALFSGVC
ncbi:raftlin isoform X1 [Astyanax mexicanus]|uniref:Raftlin isoform X1 n=1 Tax=Astyanax mexicanus TaxID=7994 RepID=A0A8T2M7I4_ASTMX|nr:raftlin isoform X1 [Astyanax mexicanus]